ncbi:MAG: hypothetical protein ABI693_33895 [Bryobacteraceae bacterium]
MSATANQLETHIQRTRADLDSNIDELTQKVKSVTDWKGHFQNHPGAIAGLAFCGGFLVAAISSRRRLPSTMRSHSGLDRPTHSGSGRPPLVATDVWDNVKSALVGVAASRLTEFVDELIPGFADHFHQTPRRP